jgi:hypothetical protein
MILQKSGTAGFLLSSRCHGYRRVYYADERLLSKGWPINNAQNDLQMLRGHRSFPTLYFFNDPRAAKGMASVSGLILHSSVDFLRPKDLLAVGNSNIHALADRVWVFTLKSENVGQKRLNARIGHGRHQSPQSHYMPARLW